MRMYPVIQILEHFVPYVVMTIARVVLHIIWDFMIHGLTHDYNDRYAHLFESALIVNI